MASAPGRKPRPEAEKKTRTQNVVLTEDEFSLIARMSEDLGCSKQEFVRRSIHKMAQDINANQVPEELRMSGDEPTLRAKGLAIEAYRQCGTVALAAHRANVTVQTIQYWAREDPVFRQLGDAAKELSVSLVKNKMFMDAMAGNTSAQFGILNAHDPSFGQIREAMIQRVLNPFISAVIDNAKRYMAVEDLHRFCAEISRAGERVALSAVRSNRGN